MINAVSTVSTPSRVSNTSGRVQMLGVDGMGCEGGVRVVGLDASGVDMMVIEPLLLAMAGLLAP